MLLLADPLRVVYLHGFASSPDSRKARFFAEKLAGLGYAVEIPDLAANDFEHLTITDQLQVVNANAGPVSSAPVSLIGSSLGGYLAALFAAAHPGRVKRLILLAPAFGFHALWRAELGPERLRHWRETGSIPVFHYGKGRTLPLSFKLMEDAAQYDPFPDFPHSCLIFHGRRDPVVPLAQSLTFAASHPHTRLVELESGHELTDVLDSIWVKSERFLMGKFT
jgi:pimeloyl-ACP methyl ester carboxylesterase